MRPFPWTPSNLAPCNICCMHTTSASVSHHTRATVACVNPCQGGGFRGGRPGPITHSPTTTGNGRRVRLESRRLGWLVNRPPGSRLLCQLSMTPQTFCPGGCIMFVCRPGVAGCPRRLPNKKLTKSYTRYPVGGASGPVRRSLWPGPAVPGRSMAVHAPDPGLYCAQRLLHSSIALNGRRGSPPFQGLGW